jgi:peptidoglycan/LPS O-acetylase OafA/YrhL
MAIRPDATETVTAPGGVQRDAQPVARQLRLLTGVPALDGLRGVAVLTVVFFHASLLNFDLRQYARSGGLGVDAFFVLSGFLITALLMREQATSGSVRLGGFYQRRALRLLPALVLLLAVHVVYAHVADLSMAAERHSVISVFFYYSNTWLHTLPTTEGLGALWSLAVEEQFYLLWPLLFLVLLGVRRRAATVLAITIALIAAVVVYRAIEYHDGTPVLVLYTRLFTRADALLIGALLAQLWVRGMSPKRGVTLALAWPALAFYFYCVVRGVGPDFLYNGGYTLIAVAVALVILAVLDTSWPVNRVLSFGPLRTIGRVSYGIYIWHLFVFVAIVRYGKEWGPWTRLSVGLTLTALATAASWVFVEQPFLRWKARLDARQRPAVHAVVDAAAAGTPAVTGEPDEAVSPESSGSTPRRRTLPVAALAVVVSALAIGGGGLWIARNEKYVAPARQTPVTFAVTNVPVVVPDVLGENAYVAAGKLVDLRLNFTVTARDDAAPAGEVIAQRPTAGTNVTEGAVVEVVISK